MRKRLEKIINTHGRVFQKFVAIEELGELQKEIIKSIRGKGNVDAIKEEIADVQIMLWQLQIMFHLTDEEIEAEINYKVNRTEEGL